MTTRASRQSPRGADSLTLNYLKKFKTDTFDIIVGNPPYQDGSGNKGKGHTLWTKFVILFLTKISEKGYLLFVNPSGWRQVDHPILNLIKKYQLLYLEIHDIKDGNATFRCSTRYDFYLIQNTKSLKKTIIKDQDGIVSKIDISKWEFIPNAMFTEIENLIIEGGEKLSVWNYRSNYGADKKHVSSKKDKIFKYPVIYSVSKGDVPNLRYSSTNENGHFEQSKFIFSNGVGFIMDKTGMYGLTQWAYCIYDDPENLEKIKKAFLSIKFKKLMEAIHLSSSTYNIPALKLFDKKFYEKFND